MPIQHHKMTIQINDKYNASDRISIAKDIIRLIKDRTDDGIGVVGNANSNGVYSETKKFNGYTPEYKKSKKFLLSGKIPTSVNLKLSKRMMSKIKLLGHDTGSISIGFVNGTKDNEKAEGNIIGSYGGNANLLRARNFLGITDKELNGVLLRYPVPGDERFSALALTGILLLKEENEDKEFFTDLDLTDIENL